MLGEEVDPPPEHQGEDPDDATIEGSFAQDPMDVPDDPKVREDEWAQYVRGFIARYDLKERQQRRAWRYYRIYRDARDRGERAAHWGLSGPGTGPRTLSPPPEVAARLAAAPAVFVAAKFTSVKDPDEATTL